MPVNGYKGNKKARSEQRVRLEDRKILGRMIVFSFSLLGVIAAGICFFCFDSIQSSAPFDPVHNRHMKTKGGIAVVVAIGMRYIGEFLFDQLCCWLDKKKNKV